MPPKRKSRFSEEEIESMSKEAEENAEADRSDENSSNTDYNNLYNEDCYDDIVDDEDDDYEDDDYEDDEDDELDEEMVPLDQIDGEDRNCSNNASAKIASNKASTNLMQRNLTSGPSSTIPMYPIFHPTTNFWSDDENDPEEAICATKSLNPKTKRNSSSSNSGAAPITTNCWSDDENDHDDNPGGVILNPKSTRSIRSSSKRSSSRVAVKRSTTSVITNFFPVITTSNTNPKLKQPMVNISSTSKSKQPPAILNIMQSAADKLKAKSYHSKRTKRRAARAKARSQMESEARRITMKNKMENTTTEIPRVYSLSIECRKRKRAVKKMKKKNKELTVLSPTEK